MATKKELSVSPPVVNKTPVFKNPKALALVGGILLALLLVAYNFKSQFVIAWVNGKPITRAEYVKALENRGGKQMLDQMINETLILDAAVRQNVSIPPEVVSQEVAKITESLKSQGQELNQALADEGMTLADLEHQILIQKLITTLTAEQTRVSDEEIAQYIKDNQKTLPRDKNTTDAEINQMVREQLEQTKQKTVINSWLADLNKNANVQYW